MDNDVTFSIAGILFMGIVWISIIALTVFCFSRILREDKNKIVGPLEVEAEIDEEEKRSHE